jgi:cytochrome b561
MPNQKYHISLRIMHWLMAAIILTLLGLGFYMAYFMDKDAANKMIIFNLHKSLGALVLFLIVVRIFMRLSKPVPALPETMHLALQKLSHLTHLTLYMLMIFMPLSGYLMSNAFGYPVHLFGLPLPVLMEKNLELGQFFSEAHEFLGFTFAGVLALHIAGVIKHRFFDIPENDVLKRMI